MSSLDAGIGLARRALTSSLVASAAVVAQGIRVAGIDAADGVLFYTAEGMPEEVGTEIAAVRAALGEDSARAVDSPLSGNDAWAAFLGAARADEVAVRLGVPGKHLEACRRRLPDGDAGRYLVDVAAGLIYGLYRPDDPRDARRWLASLRRPALAAGGYAVATQVPSGLADHLDPWGYRPDAVDLARRLKERWDPAGVLGPEGFPGG